MLIIAGVFLALVALVTYDMASRTSSPWNKEKFDEKYKVK